VLLKSLHLKGLRSQIGLKVYNVITRLSLRNCIEETAVDI